MRQIIPVGGLPVKSLALILGAITLGSPAFAAGVNSQAYRCGDLQRLIASTGFVFINNPNFEDFAVASGSYCSGGGSARVQVRSVPTTDNPECLINYCTITSSNFGGGG